jgi:hypothetical protein
MRGRFIDIPKGAKRDGWWVSIAGWWSDLPPRRRTFWQTLLWEPGQGWLRWAEEHGETISHDYMDVEHYDYVPPLHRAWYQVKAVAFCPYAMVIGTKLDEGGRYRWSWGEARPCTGGSLWCNPDRRRDLWEHDWKWDRKRKRMRKQREKARTSI